jgi:Xaa-Pro dipeptidase
MDNERLQITREAMAAAGLDALICRLPEHVVMLSGHWPLIGWSFLLFPQSGKPLIVVPHCDQREAHEELWKADCVAFDFGVLSAGDPYVEIAERLKQAVHGRDWARVGYEGGFETVAPPWNAAEPAIPAAATRALLEDVFGSDHLVDTTDILNNLRACKTPAEQNKLRRANEISVFGLELFRERVEPGISGVELAAAVEHAIMVKGTGYNGTRRVRAFAQVATGAAETAIGYRPMEISTTRKMESGDLALLELAVVADGFWCDRTRVHAAGQPTLAQQAAFDAVQAAQHAAIAAVKPGVTAGAVDQASRQVVHDAGYTDAEFLHVTGHGLGFRYHEPTPLICPGGDTVLQPGMVHTIEPGIYRADFGGVRIEDNILVTPEGAEIMGKSTPKL